MDRHWKSWDTDFTVQSPNEAYKNVQKVSKHLRLDQGVGRLHHRLILFDFSVFNTTDDGSKQQIPSVALRVQQLTTPAMRRRLITAVSDAKLSGRPYYLYI